MDGKKSYIPICLYPVYLHPDIFFKGIYSTYVVAVDKHPNKMHQCGSKKQSEIPRSILVWGGIDVFFFPPSFPHHTGDRENDLACVRVSDLVRVLGGEGEGGGVGVLQS